MNIKDEQQMAEHFGQPGPMDRIRQKRKGERAYTNDEIAEHENLAAEIRAKLDDYQPERMRAALAALSGGAQQAVEPLDEVFIEAWHGARKITVYRSTVIRVWGKNIDTEMSNEPRTLNSVQAALDWLYSSDGGVESRHAEQRPLKLDAPQHPISGGGSSRIAGVAPSPSDQDIRWSQVNAEPFEYAIQQGPHGDEFVKLLNGTCLRRPLALSEGHPAAVAEALEDCRTHRDAWRGAILKQCTPFGSDDDGSYWDHELRAFDRTFDALTAARDTEGK